ncbi:MAG: toll/interleukin-1 receptor domain-containing protein [Clostridium paraputrificum]
MKSNLSRDYVWECDYGEREILIPTLEKLLREQNATSLQMVSLFINNNPYCLELYVVVSYNKPEERHIKTMIDELLILGVRNRLDITFDELIEEHGNRRFNSFSLIDETQVKMFMKSDIFSFAEKRILKSKGYVIKPLGHKRPVFLSHSSKDKPEIEDLIPYLNASGLPIWYDKINIDYGDSIINEVQNGIKESGAVIFWITKDFLNSGWCKSEMDSFLSILIRNNNIKVISILEGEISIDKLPLFLQDRKFLKFDRPINLGLIAKEIIPTLKKHFDIKY